MSSHLALLRGVNVGGKNKVSMAELRSLFEHLGFADVSTYIQSGNVLFSPTTSVTPEAVQVAIKERLGVDVTVVLRTPRELRRAVDALPFTDVEMSKLHVGFMAHEPAHDVIGTLDAEPFHPEEFAVSGCELYLHLPNGMGRAKLPAYLDRHLQVPTTIRNWKTVTKLLELSGGEGDRPGAGVPGHVAPSGAC